MPTAAAIATAAAAISARICAAKAAAVMAAMTVAVVTAMMRSHVPRTAGISAAIRPAGAPRSRCRFVEKA